jgi:hypothetical protein
MGQFYSWFEPIPFCLCSVYCITRMVLLEMSNNTPQTSFSNNNIIICLVLVEVSTTPSHVYDWRTFSGTQYPSTILWDESILRRRKRSDELDWFSPSRYACLFCRTLLIPIVDLSHLRLCSFHWLYCVLIIRLKVSYSFTENLLGVNSRIYFQWFSRLRTFIILFSIPKESIRQDDFSSSHLRTISEKRSSTGTFSSIFSSLDLHLAQITPRHRVYCRLRTNTNLKSWFILVSVDKPQINTGHRKRDFIFGRGSCP